MSFLLLSDGVSFLLLSDGSSKLLLAVSVAVAIPKHFMHYAKMRRG